VSELVPSDQFARLPERYQRRAREIAHRVGEIDAVMAPSSVETVIDAVVRLAKQFRPQQDEDQAEIAKGFRQACRDLPEWAVSEAVNDFIEGRVDNHTGQFMPTCAEFAKRARTILMPFLAERSALRVEASKLVERAEDEALRHRIAMERQDPSVRQRVAALMADCHIGEPKSLPKRGVLTAERQARLDAMKPVRQEISKIGHQPRAAGE